MASAAMDDLSDRFADRGVTSVFIYTREAHPAENYRHHTSMEDKRARARDFVDFCQLRRRMLVDSLDGETHRAYGILPNMTYIIGRGGQILYKASWTAPRDVEDALTTMLDALPRRTQDNLIPAYSERVAWRYNDSEAFMAGLHRNGPQAVEDFKRK